EPAELRADLLDRLLPARALALVDRPGELLGDPPRHERVIETAHLLPIERLDAVQLVIGQAARRTDDDVGDVADVVARERPVLRARDRARARLGLAVGRLDLVRLGLGVVLADLYV